MSDTKPKLSLRAGVNAAEKSPSPSSAKLMLSHGKPNFTINRSVSKTNTHCPFSPTKSEANVLPVLKSTTSAISNGYVKPSVLKIPLSGENEINKVVLRRTKLPEENGKPVQSDEEPEFVKAQRKIAERLANQNNLDFESRKSGYFTHVMMSPTSPTSQKELPVIADHKTEKAVVVEVVSESVEAFETPKDSLEVHKQTQEETVNAEVEKPAENGHENGDTSQLNGSNEVEEKPLEVVEAAKALIAELVQTVAKEDPDTEEDVSKPIQNGQQNGIQSSNHNGIENGVPNGASNGDGHSQENGHSSQSDVNFEPKTITSFAKELSSEPNKYPDTVKVVTDVKPAEQDDFVQDMYKMKFDIHADNDDVKVTPAVRTTE